VPERSDRIASIHQMRHASIAFRGQRHLVTCHAESDHIALTTGPPRWAVAGFQETEVRLKLAASKLKKMDGPFGKSDPYLVLRRATSAQHIRTDDGTQMGADAGQSPCDARDGGSVDPASLHRGTSSRNMLAEVADGGVTGLSGVAVYRTEVIARCLEPEWEEFVLRLQNLCPSKRPLEDAFLIECWDYDHDSAPDLIGSVRTTMADLIRPRPNALQLRLLDRNGRSGGGCLKVVSACVVGPLKSPPSLLSGEGLCRLARRSALVATGVADMTCWERGLDHAEGLLSLANIFECHGPDGPPPERPIWRQKAMEDKAELEALGSTIPITLKEEIEAFEKDENETVSADMLSLDPPLPPPRHRKHRTFAHLPDIPKTADQTVGIVGGAEAITNVLGGLDVVIEDGNIAPADETVEDDDRDIGDESRAEQSVPGEEEEEVASSAAKVEGECQKGEWGKSRHACCPSFRLRYSR